MPPKKANQVSSSSDSSDEAWLEHSFLIATTGSKATKVSTTAKGIAKNPANKLPTSSVASNSAATPVCDKDRRFAVHKNRVYHRNKARSWRQDEAERVLEDYGYPVEWLWSELRVILLKEEIDVNWDLKHGDIVFFHRYRGVGAYCAFLLDGGDYALIKTLGEYGHMIPPHFCDAPLGYFEVMEQETNVGEQLVYLDYMYPGSEVEKYLQTEIKKVKRQGYYINDHGRFKIDSKFPDMAIWVNGDMGFVEGSQWEIENLDMKMFLKKYFNPDSADFSIQNTNMVIAVMKGTNLPSEILRLIAEFVLALPNPEVPKKPGPEARTRKARKRKRADDDIDDGNWSEKPKPRKKK